MLIDAHVHYWDLNRLDYAWYRPRGPSTGPTCRMIPVCPIFTPDRPIWGGERPHALRAGSFRRWLHAAEQLTASLTYVERRKIFHDNSGAFYRLSCTNGQI